MALMSSEEVKPGALLEKDVKNAHGQILIREGTELTERHLNLIRSWGVTEVTVRGEETSSEELLQLQDVTPENYAKAENLLRDKFAIAGLEDPVIQELFRNCVMRKAKILYG